MEIVQLKKVTEEVMYAFENLIPELNSESEIPTIEYLKEIIDAKDSYIFLAKEEVIIGILTLVCYKIPTGQKAWIEDIAVESKKRGIGVGSLLVNHAIEFAKQKGISKIDLTSKPSRRAANRLYKKLGFKVRETNVYRFHIDK